MILSTKWNKIWSRRRHVKRYWPSLILPEHHYGRIMGNPVHCFKLWLGATRQKDIDQGCVQDLLVYISVLVNNINWQFSKYLRLHFEPNHTFKQQCSLHPIAVEGIIACVHNRNKRIISNAPCMKLKHLFSPAVLKVDFWQGFSAGVAGQPMIFILLGGWILCLAHLVPGPQLCHHWGCTCPNTLRC